MKNYEENDQLEAHLRRTLVEVARTTPRVITPSATRLRLSSQRALAVAASLLVLSGLGGLVVVTQRSGETSPNGTASSEVVPPSDLAVDDPSSDSLLEAPVPGDVTPGIAIDTPGWEISPTPDMAPRATSTPSTDCPGCGADRVVFEADGPSLSGALFTTWTVDATYNADLYDQRVLIGDIEGTARTRSAATPTAQNRVTIAWPISDDQTRFVDAVGLTLDDAVAIAEASIPLLDTPSGFQRVDPPSPAPSATFVVTLTDGDRAISVFADNAGLTGLLDWRNPFPHLLLNETQPVTVDGVVLAVEIPDDADQVDGRIGAYWVAGDWGYRVTGSGFDSQEQFTEILADLRLTDTTITSEVFIMPDTFDDFDLSTGWSDGGSS